MAFVKEYKVLTIECEINVRISIVALRLYSATLEWSILASRGRYLDRTYSEGHSLVSSRLVCPCTQGV